MISLFEITRLKDSFEYQTWQIEMRDQLIFMNLWHYVEIDELSSSTILIVEISIKENLNAFVVSTSEKVRKFRIDNLKTVAIIRNRLKCNDRNLLKNEINATKTWQILKKSFSSCESKILNDLLIKLWIIILVISQNVIDYARRFKKTLQDIRKMIIEMFINDNILILYFHLDLDAKYEQYRKHYVQTHDIVSVELNLAMKINYAINKFLNICVNRFVFVESVVIMTVIVNISSLVVLEIKNVVIIQMKHCIHCDRNYHVKNECRNKHFHLKRDRDQSDRDDRDDRDNKRRRKNDNDNDNDARSEDDENIEKSHKLYIVMILETLSTMSVMFAHIIFWILNNACFQHSIREKTTFIFYTTFSKLISVSDLKDSTIAMRQDIVKLSCKIDNRRMNISFSNAFYVSKCSLNLINFDQLNEIRCFMSYKSNLFTIEDQDIITKKRVNNVFFFELWKHVSYNFIITFIVDNLVATFVESLVESFIKLLIKSFVESSLAVNKKILNIWHARLKHLREQNVRRFVKMSNEMNLIKSVANKNSCESCIVIKQKIESHNNLVIFDKHLLNLMWSDLVQSFVFNDKVKYFVTFLCDFIKRSMIYVLRVKSNTFDAFRHFQQHNEHEDNRVRRLRIDWEEKYFSDEFDNYRFEHDIEWESIVSKTSKQNEIVERLRQTLMSMISIMLKDVDLNDKWWIELIKTVNYFRNRSSMTNKSIIFFEIDTKRKFFFAHFRRIETTSYVMKRKSITKWKKLAFRSFSVMLVNYEKEHIYRMLRLNEIIYRVSSVIWIKKKRKESFSFISETSTKRSIIESVIFSTKRQVLESNSIIILMLSSQLNQSIDVVSLFSVLSTAKANTSSIESISSTSILSALKRHLELRYRLDFFDSLDLLIMRCIKNVSDFQQTLKSRSYKEIMNDLNRNEWLKIMKNENKSLLINEIWTLTNSFRDKRVLRDKWVYKIKKEKHDEILRYKTRWMIRKFEQVERLDYTKTFVSMIKSMSYKTMYVITVVNDWEIEQMNVKTTFLYDKILEDVYVVQLTNFEKSVNQVFKLNKALYDLKQSSRIWFETLIKFLFSLSYVSLNVEFNVFMRDDIMIVIYVNDLILTRFNFAAIFWLKNALNERFEMSDLDSCIYYLDMMIFRNRRLKQLILNQSIYVEQMLRDHEMWNCKSLIIFMNVSCRLVKISDEYTADKSFKISYQSIVKSLMYIMLKTRSNIAYSISMISRYVFNLIQTHWQAVKRIFRYLRKTYQMKLMFREALKFLKNYTNSNWAENQDIRRSISEYAFNVNSDVISWFSKRQFIVTLFICETEYTKQILVAKEAIWLRNLMIQLTCDVEYSQTMMIYENNQSAIVLIKNSQFHARIKHIDIQIHFIREKVTEESIDLFYVLIDQMIADDLIKSLIRDKFVQFRAALEIE